MKNRNFVLVYVACVVVGLSAACAAPSFEGGVDELNQEGGDGSENGQAENGDDNAAAVGEGERDGKDKNNTERGHLANGPTLDRDGGVSTTRRPLSASITIDGRTCAVEPSKAGLDMGLNGNGWTMNVRAESCGGFSLRVSGTDDGTYPQTGAKAGFLQEQRVLLFTNEGVGDAGIGAGTYRSTGATVRSGPTKGTPATVEGDATVATTSGTSRRVTFRFIFD